MRMNISIPDSLRKKMDRMKNVNWSKVAQVAFTEVVEGKRLYVSEKVVPSPHSEPETYDRHK